MEFLLYYSRTTILFHIYTIYIVLKSASLRTTVLHPARLIKILGTESYKQF